jgi:hypothetical protein
VIVWSQLSRAERLGYIKPLWDAGKSASEIADTIDGASRQAVIGVLHRAGLRRGIKVNSPKPRTAKPRQPYIIAGCGAVIEKAAGQAPKSVIRPDAFDPLRGSHPKPWLERAFGECCWPVGGEGAETLSCCLPVEGNGWCAAHLALGTVAPKPGRPRTANELARSLRRYVA